MNQNNDENRRERFRVRLPADSMLEATINGLNYDVVEVAEFSIVVTATQVINKNGVCTGSIQWSDGHLAKFAGVLGRISEQGRVIENIAGFSTPDILKEQRRLLKKFPEVMDPSLPQDLMPGIFNPDIE